MRTIQPRPDAPPKTKKPEVGGVRLWLILMKAFHAISAYTLATAHDSGLGESDFLVLEALLHKGPLPVNTLGAKVFLTPGSISVAVQRLSDRGLVARAESAADRRVRTVSLTPKGQKLIETAFAAHAARIEELTATLTPKERRRAAAALKTLGLAAAERSRA